MKLIPTAVDVNSMLDRFIILARRIDSLEEKLANLQQQPRPTFTALEQISVGKRGKRKP
jgi:hypothetical protein